MADGTAWRLVSQCATVEDVVRVFRTLASADGLTGVPVSGIGPGGGSQVRVVVALSSKAAVLDGDAVVTTGPGTISVRFVKIDARGKGLLAHMVEHKAEESPPAVPRHLIPLGAAAGTPVTARGDVSMAKCMFEPMGQRGAASRQPAPPTIRDSGPAPSMTKPKREAQRTLMGMPTLSAARNKPATAPPPVIAAAAAATATPAVIAPQPSSGATTTPVVAMGTPPVGLDQSAPVPRGGAELRETGPTKPTRGAGVTTPAMAAAAQAIAATPVAPFDNVVTVPTAQDAIRRVQAAPSGPVDDMPTLPNEDLQTDVSVALPDLPGGDYVDPIVEPPAPAMVHAPPPAEVYAAAGSSPGWQMPPSAPVAAPAPVYAAQSYYPTPYPLAPQPGIAPMMIERDEDMTEMVQLVRPGGGRRWPVIAVTSAVIVIGVAVMVVVAARGSGGGGGSGTSASPPAPPPSAPIAPAAVDLPEPQGAETPASCKVSFTSSPQAVDVVLGGKVIGTTPFEHEGSCDAYQVTFKREKYQSQTKELAAGATTLDVRLERPQYKVRVTSRPSGAHVKVGGASLGKTPVTITLPGFETTSIELVRGGVTTTQRVYPGKSGHKVDVKLKTRR